MTDKTLPTLTATASPADDSIFLIRRNGQVEDEKVTGANLKAYLLSSAAISGATIDNSVIGGTTPAAGTFTTLAANTIDTGQGAVECYAMDQAVRTSDSVSFSALSLTTDLAVTHGGTGASNASGARTNLGLVIGTDVQAQDAGLQSIAGLTTAANNGIYTTALDTYATYSLTAGGRALGGVAGTSGTFPYFSGTNTVSLATITAAGRALIDDASASAQRTTLGLVIGTDVQAQDAGLQSIAGLTTAADRMIYTTASDTYAVTPLTSFARTLLDDSDAATARSTLGLGTIATQASSNVSITGGSISGITDLAIADGGTGASTAGGARTNLGLGSIATQDANNVNISGGSISGITDLAIADGGTGASTAAGAKTNLGIVSLIGVEVFTSSGSFTKGTYSDAVKVKVIVTGGGGGGAGSGTALNNCSGGSGAAGGTAIEVLDVSSLSASETVTVGAAGTAGSTSGNGGAGGTSSFGAFCSATGGAGGVTSSSTTIAAGGAGSGGDVNLTGGDGSHPQGQENVAVNRGAGGTSYWGGGGQGGFDSGTTAATAGNAPGSGGGAGGRGGAGAAQAGAAGAAGIVVVEIYG